MVICSLPGLLRIIIKIASSPILVMGMISRHVFAGTTEMWGGGEDKLLACGVR